MKISVRDGDLSDSYLKQVTQLGADCIDFGSGTSFQACIILQSVFLSNIFLRESLLAPFLLFPFHLCNLLVCQTFFVCHNSLFD